MSLIDNLVPEVRELFEADAEQYPSLIEAMKEEMSNPINMVMDLSVRTANILIGYGEKVGVEFEYNDFINKLYNVFGK